MGESAWDELLSEHQDLIEHLDSESLFGYLLQNGVLDTSSVNDIKNTNEGVEVTKSLLRYVENTGNTNHHGLLINALRQTGHLQLANLLEVGPRIQPRRWNSLGYLNRTRHKGQVCFILQVNAIEISPDEFPRRKGLSGISYWIWLDDLKLEPPPDVSALHLQTSISQPHINDKITEPEQVKSSWCCGCFSRSKKTQKIPVEKQPKKAKKGKKYQKDINTNTNNASDSLPRELVPVIENEPLKLPQEPSSEPEPLDASDSGLENSESEENFDELKMKADIMHKKSSKFYKLLLDLDGKVRNMLVQYFEQVRGILVLDTIFEDGIIIVCISTKIQQLMSLQEDFLNGQLVQELEQSIVNEEVRQKISVKSMKLQLSVDEEEFPKAIHDLEG